LLTTAMDRYYDLQDIKIYSIRGLVNVDKLLKEAFEKYNDSRIKCKDRARRYFIKKFYGTAGDTMSSSFAKGSRDQSDGGSVGSDKAVVSHKTEMASLAFNPLYLTRLLEGGPDDHGQPCYSDALSSLALTENMKKVYAEVKVWLANEKWFKERRIPWKKGYLCYGEAGTGKTAFIRALAQELDLPIMVFDLSTMTNREFNEFWQEAIIYSPCIVLIEDVDSIFDGRKNITSTDMNNGLSFDSFLNTLDGVENTDGILKFITTNNIEKIDPALGTPSAGDAMSSRPGRIDTVVEFTKLDRAGRYYIASRIFKDIPEKKWLYLVDENDHDTGAQFQERCIRLACQLFWSENGKLKSKK